MHGQPGHNTRPGTRLPPSLLGMDDLITECGCDSQSTRAIDVLGLFFDMISMGFNTLYCSMPKYWYISPSFQALAAGVEAAEQDGGGSSDRDDGEGSLPQPHRVLHGALPGRQAAPRERGGQARRDARAGPREGSRETRPGRHQVSTTRRGLGNIWCPPLITALNRWRVGVVKKTQKSRVQNFGKGAWVFRRGGGEGQNFHQADLV